jgi:dienelactone hydrolase
MKYFFLSSLLICFTTGLLAQAVQPAVKTWVPSGQNDQWDLNKYVWSHAHYQAGKSNKAVLDYDAIDNYTGIGADRNLAINGDGKYIAYNVCKGSSFRSDRLVVQSVTNDWRQEFPGSSPGFFSGDGKQYIFFNKDSLCFLQVGQNGVRTEKGVASVKQTADGKNEWVAYPLKNGTGTVVLENLLTGQQKRFDSVKSCNFEKNSRWFSCLLGGAAGELVIYNLTNGNEQHFQSVTGYLFDDQGQALVLKMANHPGNGARESLVYVKLADGKRSVIWSGTDNNITIKSFDLDELGKQVVLVGASGTNNSVWYWKEGMEAAIKKVDDNVTGIGSNLQLQAASFSDNGNYLLLTLQKRSEEVKPGREAVPVDVWSYKDSVLQSVQPSLLKKPRRYKVVLSLASGRVLYCEQDYEYITVRGDVGLVERNSNEKEWGDRFWEKDYDKGSYQVISLKDSLVLGAFKVNTRGGGEFSSNGHYLVYFDGERGCNYFSIDLQTGKEANISGAVPVGQLGYENFYRRPHEKPIWPVDPMFIAAWLEEEGAILVYDSYDIWQLDLAGKKPAMNITNGYGRRHHIILRLAGKNRDPVFLPGTKEVLIKAFNRDTKYNGYYKRALGAAGYPELLYMGPCVITGSIFFGDKGMEPLQASGANVWVVRRQTATDAPNYFLTTDFKSYQPVTNLQRQQQYNWYTTELHSFKQLDGTITQGILYKPENFDPTKKYPVIINFYAQLSQNLNRFWRPDYINAPHLFENPGWMVNHGYLVFLPDIYFTKDQYGPSTVNTVDGAAKYVSTLPFVDAKHIGACGHSNGGRFGYYLFTHSHLFTAMALGSGFGGTNVLSLGLSLDDDNVASNLYWAERGALGAALGNLWQNKASWLDHTAVLNADKASSPLLLFHNKKDADEVRLAVELFTALRRLGKKVWWLQYDRGYHVVNENDARDYTIRFTQFFDHYLKGAPAPRWMTKGIPYKWKGVEAGYELDRTNK